MPSRASKTLGIRHGIRHGIALSDQKTPESMIRDILYDVVLYDR